MNYYDMMKNYVKVTIREEIITYANHLSSLTASHVRSSLVSYESTV